MYKYLVEIVIDILNFEEDPDTLTGFLNITPTTVSRKGVKAGKTVAPVQNVWSVRSHPPMNSPEAQYSLDSHWGELYGRIAGKQKLFREVSLRAQAKMTIIVNSDGRYPPVRIRKEMIDYAHAAGFSMIDVDIYERD